MTMTTDQKIGERIHQIMWTRKIRQTVLAEQLGLGQGAVSKKLHGDRKWTVDELMTVAAVLDVPITDLLPTTRENERIALPTSKKASATTRGQSSLPLPSAA